MKNKKCKFFTLILAIVIIFSTMAIPAFAATNKILNSEYSTIYTNTSGKERYVWVEVFNQDELHHTDIRMLDKNKNVVWEEYGAIGTSASRKFTCGSNVAYIQARVGAKNILGWLRPLAASCNVWE